MPIGISDDHVELADAFGKWAGSLGGIEAARAAEDDPAATFAEITAAVGEMGLLGITADGGLAARPRRRRRGVRRRAACRGRCSARPSRRVRRWLAGPWRGRAGRPRARRRRWSTTHRARRTPWSWWTTRCGSCPLDGADLTPGPTPDLTRRTSLGDLTAVDGTVVPASTPARLRALVVTLAAAEASGVARWCLDTAVEYAGVREQFGRKIGAFQAIKHLCAEMLETSESVTAAAWDAARASPTTTPAARVRRARRRRRLLRRRRRGRQGLHPGARRHRLHLRARRPPLPAPRARAARLVGPLGTYAAAAGRPRRRAAYAGTLHVDLDAADDGRAGRGARPRRSGSPPCRTTSSARALAESGLPDPALAGALRPRRRPRAPAGDRRGARPRPASSDPT